MKEVFEDKGRICIITDDMKMVEDILERHCMYIEDNVKHLDYTAAKANIEFYQDLELLFDARQEGGRA